MKAKESQNLFDLEEAANYLRMRPSYLSSITRTSNRVIPCIQAGRSGRKLFTKADLDQYLNQNIKPANV